jgi:sugar/nucleoside kinase (ribokinase family)
VSAVQFHEKFYDLFEGRNEQSFAKAVTGPGARNYTNDGVSAGLASAISSSTQSNEITHDQALAEPQETPNVFVAGSLAVDLACDFHPRTGSTASAPEQHTSNPAKIMQSLGGVGHNVARAAQLMGAKVQLCSIVGDDLAGKAVLEALNAEKLPNAGIATLEKASGARTAQYVAMNDSSKDLVIAMADMSILDGDDATLLKTFETHWLPALRKSKPSHVVLDANWSPKLLSKWLAAAHEISAYVTLEPVSTAKVNKIFQLPPTTSGRGSASMLPVFPSPQVHLITPNSHELAALHTYASSSSASLGNNPHHFSREDWWTVINAFGIPDTGARAKLCLATSQAIVDQGIPQQCLQLLPFFPTIAAKLGRQGVLLVQILPAGDARLQKPEYAEFILSQNPAAEALEGTTTNETVGGVYMRLFPPPEDIPAEDIRSVNGVGDTLAGALVAGLARGSENGKDVYVEDLVDLAQRAAGFTLKSLEAVSEEVAGLKDLLN